MGSDAQIWKHIAESQEAKDANLNIEVKEINGGVVMNNATKEGEVDVNAFQSWGYLVSYNKDSNANLVAVSTTYLEPMEFIRRRSRISMTSRTGDRRLG